MNKNAVVVTRASHTQKVPHDNRPHNAPAKRVTAMNSTPISALAPAMRSQASERVRRHRYAADDTAVTMKATYATQTVPTCTYRMRTLSPWITSGGESTRPNSATAASETTVAAPSQRVNVVPVPRPVGVGVPARAGAGRVGESVDDACPRESVVST